MDALVNTAPGCLERRQLPTPDPGHGQVRIRTLACGVCATDLEMIQGWSRTGFPAIPGHEWCGVVDMVGPGGDAALIGRHCVGDNVLPDGGEVGFEHPGGYAQYFLTQEANLRLLPDGTDPAVATLIEPLAVCLRGLRRLRPLGNRPTLVVGDGAIGLLMTTLLAGEGATELAVLGGVPERLALARTLGASATEDYHAADLQDWLASRFAVVIEASGTEGGMRTALAAAANQGTVLIPGDYGEHHANFPWNDLLHRELALVGSNAGTGAWDEAVSRFLAKPDRFVPIVTHRIPASDHAEAIDLARTRRDGAARVVITWPTAL